MTGIERLRERLIEERVGKRLRIAERMAAHTSFGIGGPADLLITAERLDELVSWVSMAHAKGVPCMVLGSGTNVLVSDAGIRGLVILNACQHLKVDSQGLLRVESGALFRQVARHTVSQGWAGLEWAVDIPGTVGGAVVGNAGAYGGYIADLVQNVRLLQPDGRVQTVPREALDYGYRTSALKRESMRERRSIVLEATLQLVRGNAQALRERAQEVTKQRQMRTPMGACAGSMFKRTQQYPAGFLIEQAGLKGLRVGGAQISPKHANFFMNTGNATAEDVIKLIKLVQERIWRDFAQRLEPEIELIGDWSASAALRQPYLDRIEVKHE